MENKQKKPKNPTKNAPPSIRLYFSKGLMVFFGRKPLNLSRRRLSLTRLSSWRPRRCGRLNLRRAGNFLQNEGLQETKRLGMTVKRLSASKNARDPWATSSLHRRGNRNRRRRPE